MLNIVIPMAGRGSRFSNAGYKLPKPLIDVGGKPMIERVVINLTPQTDFRFIFICQKEHNERYNLTRMLTDLSPGSIVIDVDGVTQGAACTVLYAREYIDNNSPLMIANSDQYVDISISDYIDQISRRNLDGLIMTMNADDPKWSFVGLDDDLMVTRVVEKEVISNEATVGIYNFAHGSDFVRCAELMIAEGNTVNGEYYVAPVYNSLIAEGKRVGIYNVGSEAHGMYGLGIPSDLDLFLSLNIVS